MRSIFFFYILSAVIFLGCRKEERITTDANVKLAFSKDSVLFDTVFTTLGSVTRVIKVLNLQSSALNIAEISLAGGNSSPFSININGESAVSAKNVLIGARDSISLFIKVTINPNNQALPFMIQDSILFKTNGNKQSIKLCAYGQNAVFINETSINVNTTWTEQLPYIINSALTIKNNAILTINPGAKIYFRKDASLNIEGNLVAIGSKSKPIMFCGDRLESIYNDEPGQWKGIYIKRTGAGIIRYSTIKNASVGITSDSLSVNPKPKLILSNTIVKNMQVAGYVGYHSELIAFNNLFYNCGNYLVYAVGGGHFNIKQNTFAGYNLNFPRKTAAITFSDYLSAKEYNMLDLNLTNNIIWGVLSNELDIQHKTNIGSQTVTVNNLIKTSSKDYSGNGNIININPQFAAQNLADFELTMNSPALKKGIDLSADPYFTMYLSDDLNNVSRSFPSSLGCFEKK